MARYIDADALIQELERRIAEANEAHIAIVDDDFIALVHDADAADVRENVHGEWIYDYEYNGEDEIPVAVCSVCEKSVYDFIRSNFCPNCGADMKCGE